MKQIIAKVGSGAALALVNVQIAAAAVTPPDVDNPIQGNQDFGEVLAAVVQALLLFAAAVAVLFLIIGGFRYVVSTGNEQQVDAARKTILYSVLGLIIIFIAFVLTQVVLNALDVRGQFNV